jgi:hypothetical protein
MFAPAVPNTTTCTPISGAPVADAVTVCCETPSQGLADTGVSIP